MCMPKVKTEKTDPIQEAPAPQATASAVASPTLDMTLAKSGRGRKSLSLKRQPPGAASTGSSGLGTSAGGSGLGTN